MASILKWRGWGCFERNSVIGQDFIIQNKSSFAPNQSKIGEILENLEKIQKLCPISPIFAQFGVTRDSF